MVFYDIIIMWLLYDPEILSFSSDVWFIELAEVFGVKVMCIYVYISAPQKLHIKKAPHIFAVCCVMFKNKGGLILIY